LEITALTLHSAADLALFCAPSPALPSLQPAGVTLTAPDQSWLMSDGGAVTARYSLWWQRVPDLPGERLGLIGHYAAADERAGAAALARACQQLAGRGCTLAVGPMDGSTWHRYRLLTERGAEPPFFLEPDNPDGWPEHFTSSGFDVLAGYFSSLNPDLSRRDPRVPAAQARLAGAGVAIRALDLDHFDAELQRIFAVAQVSFRPNFLYTPLTAESFLDLYRPLRMYVHPELVLIAEQEGRPVGFLFATPDWLQAQRGQQIDSVVVKTVAVLPERAFAGLGAILGDICHQRALELGYRRAIHALMHENNVSLNISRRTGTVIRRYALYSRRLAPQSERP
jgi:hypothetical protein